LETDESLEIIGEGSDLEIVLVIEFEAEQVPAPLVNPDRYILSVWIQS
jgi:hypothetical protein